MISALLAITVQFAAATSSGPESVSPANIPVTLSAPSTQTVTVTYKVTSGSAGPMDYRLPSGTTVTFAPGQTQQSIPLTILEDNLYEGNEDIVLVLQVATNALIGQPAGHTHTIVDNEARPVIQFAAAKSSAAEGPTVDIDVAASSTLPGYGITVNYAVIGGNAVNGIDYTLDPGQLKFYPGDKVKTISFPVPVDGEEWDETVVIGLSSPSGGGSTVSVGLGTQWQHTHVILGDGPSGCTAPPVGVTCVKSGPIPPSGICWCCR